MRSAWCGLVRGSKILGALGSLALIASCAGKSEDPAPARCASDADCASEFRCDKSIDRPAKGTIPCPNERICSTQSECSAGEVCAPSWQVAPEKFACEPLLCGEPCTADSCPADATCGASGRCELIPCDAPDGLACAEHWRCDPEAANTESPNYFPGTITPEPDPAREIGHGCVRIPCDEPNGYECMELYACRADETTGRPACLPERCEDTGRCRDDEFWICASESKHPDFGADEHGCVPRACDEGLSCSYISPAGVDIGYCDYSAPNAEQTLGCTIRPCESDADCGELRTCDSTGAFPDGQGCRDLTCSEGRPCPSGWLCDPTMTADWSGCYHPPSTPGAGGAGGSGAAGGASGSGATSGSSSATGGTVGIGDSRDGQCVRR